MEEKMLPSINNMYKFTLQNRDYNVLRTYQDTNKHQILKQKPTKRQNYLDDFIRYSCSPGPANKANSQQNWKSKVKAQTKRGEKETYLDQITKRQNKLKFPSPNQYKIDNPWPKKVERPKNVSQKITFTDTCQYQADKIPGPGTYSIPNLIKCKKSDNKWSPHQPLKINQTKAAQMATYNPCPVEYNTFDRMKRHISHQTLPIKPEKKIKHSKQNNVPGPGTYPIINHWAGKVKSKKHQFSLNSLSGIHSSRVYNS